MVLFDVLSFLPVENILIEKVRTTFRGDNRAKSVNSSSKTKPVYFSSVLELPLYNDESNFMVTRIFILALEMIGAPLVLLVTVILLWIRRRLLKKTIDVSLGTNEIN